MRWYWQVLWFLATPFVGFGVFYACVRILPPVPPASPKTQWRAGDGPTPKYFRYLAYPKTDRVVIYSDKNKTPAGYLDRALSNSEEERQRGGLVDFNQPDGQRWVDWADLRFDPPPERATTLEQTWKAVYGGQRPGQYADVLSEPTSAGTRLTLTIGDREQTWQFVYHVENGQPVAEEERWKSRRDDVLSPQATNHFLIVAGAGGVSALLWLIVGARLAQRKRRTAAVPKST